MALKTFGRFLLKISGLVLFCAVSAYALFFAYGYNLNFQNRNIEKTSIIDITNNYSKARVYLDHNIIAYNLPFQIKNLIPSFYNLTILKFGYMPWNRKLEVQPDIVTKVDDAVLIPEGVDKLVQQLVHFPNQSRYFFSNNFFIVLSPDQNYLTLVSLNSQGTIDEEEFPLDHTNIQNIQVFEPQKFLITFTDNSYEWVEFDTSRTVHFTLPKDSSQLSFIPEQNAAFFLNDGNIYRVPIDLLASFTLKNSTSFLLVKGVEQFDIHPGKLLYLAHSMAYMADDQGGNPRLIDRSDTLTYVRFIPFNGISGGLLVMRTAGNKRLVYAMDDAGFSDLLTPQLKGDISMYTGGIFLSDESGNIFLYDPVIKKKLLITTLATDFNLLGSIFDDGHFLFIQKKQLLLADSSFSNVYPLSEVQENDHYLIYNGAIFFLSDDGKLKSLFLPTQ